MTNPRINNAPYVTSHPTIRSANTPSSTRVAAESADDSFGPVDFIEDAARSTGRRIAGYFAGSDPSDNVKKLEPGQSAVGEVAVGAAIAKGVGFDASMEFSYSVTRSDDDVYQATFELSEGLAGSLGARFQSEGVTANVGAESKQRLIITGKGEGAREELAQILDLSSPIDGIDTLLDAEHLQIARTETGGGPEVGVQAGIGLGVDAKVGHEVWVGAEHANGASTPFVRHEFSNEWSLSTPTLELADSEATADFVAQSLSRQLMIPVDVLPREQLAKVIAANGGVAGLDIRAEVTVGLEIGQRQRATGVVTLHMGGNAIEFELKSEIDPAKLDLATSLEQVASDPRAALGLFNQPGLDTQLTVSRVEFSGVSVSGTPFTEGRSGVEEKVVLYSIGGVIR